MHIRLFHWRHTRSFRPFSWRCKLSNNRLRRRVDARHIIVRPRCPLWDLHSTPDHGRWIKQIIGCHSCLKAFVVGRQWSVEGTMDNVFGGLRWRKRGSAVGRSRLSVVRLLAHMARQIMYVNELTTDIPLLLSVPSSRPHAQLSTWPSAPSAFAYSSRHQPASSAPNAPSSTALSLAWL